MEKYALSIKPTEQTSLKPIAIDNSNNDKILSRSFIIK